MYGAGEKHPHSREKFPVGRGEKEGEGGGEKITFTEFGVFVNNLYFSFFVS